GTLPPTRRLATINADRHEPRLVLAAERRAIPASLSAGAAKAESGERPACQSVRVTEFQSGASRRFLRQTLLLCHSQILTLLASLHALRPSGDSLASASAVLS